MPDCRWGALHDMFSLEWYKLLEARSLLLRSGSSVAILVANIRDGDVHSTIQWALNASLRQIGRKLLATAAGWQSLGPASGIISAAFATRLELAR